MSDIIKDEVVVDLLQINEFTEDHLDIVEEIYETHWKKFYPELYGDKLPDAIQFEGFTLLPASAKTAEQRNRVGSTTVKAKFLEIKQNIERNGFKLKYPPISWFRWNNNEDGHVTITGDTRGDILAAPPFETKKWIVAVYKRNPGFTNDQVQDAIDSCGLRFNAIHDPAAPLSIFDVKRTVQLAVDRYLKTDGEAGVAPTIDEIEKRVDYVCGEGVFQPATRLNLIYEIYNTFDPENVVISWSDAVKATYRISTFLTRNKLVDTDKVKYLYTSFELYSKAFTRACKVATEYPDAEVRVVIHTGTLRGYDLASVYRLRVQKFVSQFNAIKYVVGAAADKAPTDIVGVTFNRIKIYGVLPALGSIHDVEVPFFINERTGKFYQKTNPYIFDVTEDDDVEEEIEELDEAA